MFPYTGLSITYIPVYSNFSSKIFSLCEVEFIQEIEENNTISAMKTKIELEEISLSEDEQKALDLVNEYRRQVFPNYVNTLL